MKKKVVIAIFGLLFPLMISAQASGGQIRRPNRVKQARSNTPSNNRQRTTNQHNRNNVQPKRSLPTGKVNGYDAIDLGLSVRWAACNIGANKPEGFGGLFAYGEPTGRKFTRNIDDYPGGKSIVNSDLDIAKFQWGNGWRLPTEEELREIKEKCNWEYVDNTDVIGYHVTGPNGNSIFLPLAGSMPYSNRQEDGRYGYYWSGESPNNHYSFALVLCGGSYVSVESGSNYVYEGMSVRAVTR